MTFDTFQITVTTTLSAATQPSQGGLYGTRKKTPKPSASALTTTQESYEKNIRQAANDGKAELLQKLVDTPPQHLKPANLDAFGATTGKTALHRVIEMANTEQGSERIEEYKTCYQILVDKDASLSIKDNEKNTPADYDKGGFFFEHEIKP